VCISAGEQISAGWSLLAGLGIPSHILPSLPSSPPSLLHSIANPKVDWCFQTEPVPGLHGRALAYPRGKVLGGCSSINGMIYMRGQAEDYDGWAQEISGGEGGREGGKEDEEEDLGKAWSWKEVLPYFVKSEDYAVEGAKEGGRDFHGVGGEWRVEKQRLSWELLDKFRDACAEHGIPKVDDFNTGCNEGSSYFHVNQWRGVRWNTSKVRWEGGRGGREEKNEIGSSPFLSDRLIGQSLNFFPLFSFPP